MPTQLVRSAKNALKGYTSAQVLVRDATANESEGPSVDMLDELAHRSYDSVEFFEIMDMIDKRLNDKGKYWKHVAKSLTVLDYLVRFGSENCVLWCRENLYIIKTLREFRHDDDGTQDGGQIIRVKAKELTNLLMDDERLRMERGEDPDAPPRMRSPSPPPPRRNSYDSELQRAIDESRLTAEDDERRRKALNNEDADLETALQLSKEEEELKRLQELQRSQQEQQRLSQMQPQGYYDIFGNPISPEEYMQYQQQQELFAREQQQQELLAQQQEQQRLLEQQQEQQRLAEEQKRLAEEQQKQQEAQYWAMQLEALAQQQALDQQQALAAQQAQLQEQQKLAALQRQQQDSLFQNPVSTGSNNPFALNGMQLESNSKPQVANDVPSLNNWANNSGQVEMPKYQPRPQQQPQKTEPEPMQPVRTGNQSISDKYGDLNKLLSQPTGVDTFGNVGDARIPAQHTKTGTFINSQGTGFKQYSSEPKKNPFLPTQFTGIPTSTVLPSHTGYGFGNQQAQNQSQSQPPQQPSDQGVSLIDL